VGIWAVVVFERQPAFDEEVAHSMLDNLVDTATAWGQIARYLYLHTYTGTYMVVCRY
jgi:hypothetical protein